ncbi:MAG: hypothetical protein WCF20_08715 [Methylovirgula sp.]
MTKNKLHLRAASALLGRHNLSSQLGIESRSLRALEARRSSIPEAMMNRRRAFIHANGFTTTRTMMAIMKSIGTSSRTRLNFGERRLPSDAKRRLDRAIKNKQRPELPRI